MDKTSVYTKDELKNIFRQGRDINDALEELNTLLKLNEGKSIFIGQQNFMEIAIELLAEWSVSSPDDNDNRAKLFDKVYTFTEKIDEFVKAQMRFNTSTLIPIIKNRHISKENRKELNLLGIEIQDGLNESFVDTIVKAPSERFIGKDGEENPRGSVIHAIHCAKIVAKSPEKIGLLLNNYDQNVDWVKVSESLENFGTDKLEEMVFEFVSSCVLPELASFCFEEALKSLNEWQVNRLVEEISSNLIEEMIANKVTLSDLNEISSRYVEVSNVHENSYRTIPRRSGSWSGIMTPKEIVIQDGEFEGWIISEVTNTAELQDAADKANNCLWLKNDNHINGRSNSFILYNPPKNDHAFTVRISKDMGTREIKMPDGTILNVEDVDRDKRSGLGLTKKGDRFYKLFKDLIENGEVKIDLSNRIEGGSLYLDKDISVSFFEEKVGFEVFDKKPREDRMARALKCWTSGKVPDCPDITTRKGRSLLPRDFDGDIRSLMDINAIRELISKMTDIENPFTEPAPESNGINKASELESIEKDGIV